MLISDFSKVTGLKQTTIRFYIGMGLLHPMRVSAGGSTYHQHFSEEDVRAVKTVGLLQSVGCSLNDIAAMCKELKTQSTNPARSGDILNLKINMLEKKQREFESMILLLREQLGAIQVDRLP